MTHDHAPDHSATTHEPGQPYFPSAEWEAFRREDVYAGKILVALMGGIFTIGLLLYLTVALVVAL